MSKTTIPAGGIADSAVTTAKINADAVDATKIADDAISEEHLDATAITGHTALAEAPADTDEFLISDGGTLKRLDAQYVGGTGLTHISTVSGTSAVSSVLINDCFSSTYKTYKLFGTVLVDTDDTKLEMQYTKSSGSTVGTDAYRYIINLLNLHSDSSRSDASTGNWADSGGAELVYAIDNDATYSPVQFEMTFYDPGQHFASYQYFDGRFTYYSSGGQFRIGTLGGQYRQNFNATGLKFKTDSNNFSRYYFNVYGITNSGS